MKKAVIRMATLAAMVVAVACSKKTEEKALKDKPAIAATDSVAIKAAQKQKAEEEKAKLPKPYHPEDNATAKIDAAVKQAKAEHKNVMLQAGGNWCIWCLRFNNFVQTTPELKALVDENYVYYHLNYSEENKNTAVFAKYGEPGKKYGYPVFLVLDGDGKLIHTQDSSLLEEGKGYSVQKVKDFFNAWKVKK